MVKHKSDKEMRKQYHQATEILNVIDKYEHIDFGSDCDMDGGDLRGKVVPLLPPLLPLPPPPERGWGEGEDFEGWLYSSHPR